MRVVVSTAVFLLACAAPAAAHPFGPPSTAQAQADGTTLTLSWRAAEDDWVALGQSVGAFDSSTSLTGEEKLRRSPEVRDYLLDRITVTQAGTRCAAELAPLGDLMADGAHFTFSCAQPVSEVDIRLSALTDLDEAYRTVLTADAAPDRALFTSAQDTVRLRFSGGGSGVTASVIGLAVGTMVAAVGVVVLMRRKRSRERV